MNKTLNYLGLARKAGKIVLGTDAVLKNLNSHKIHLIYVASDASFATIDKVDRKGFFYSIPVNKKYSTTDLEHALGVSNIKVLGVTDVGFAKKMMEELEREGD